MKKVIGLIGSLRKNSIHRTLFNHYQKFSEMNFELFEGKIEGIPLYNQDILDSPVAVLDLANLIKESDGIIFFSPEYNYSVPGVLKNAIDWLSRSDLKPFDNKLASIIGASPGNIGTARMQYHLRQIGVFLNLKFLNRPEVMIGKALEKIANDKIIDHATVEFLIKHSQSFLTAMN